jgi:hypothetical protein
MSNETFVDEDAILEQIEQMEPAQLEAEAKKILARREAQKTYRQKELTPEAKEKRAAYRKERYAREKAILAAAKANGLV